LTKGIVCDSLEQTDSHPNPTDGNNHSATAELDLPIESSAIHCIIPGNDDADNISTVTSPFQPPSTHIPDQKLSKRTLRFQAKWFEDYRWLHYSPTQQGVLCFYCAKVCAPENMSSRSLPWAKCADPAFVSRGFSNWKKGVEKFKQHQSSHTHFLAVNHFHSQTKTVDVQLHGQLQAQQTVAAKCLRVILTSVKYLAEEGLALRGHETEGGHLYQLLRLRASDAPELSQWLTRHESYTSANIQNEILTLLANAVLRQIVNETTSLEPVQFSVMVDGTRDISGIEQESICVRYVDKDFNCHEEFLGMYEAKSTTGAAISSYIFDALLRLGFPKECLRGQTYDGAANMAGPYKGCQALVRLMCPLALYVHCGPHSVNLVMECVISSHPNLRDSVQCVHDLGVLHSQNGKFKSLFTEVAAGQSTVVRNLRPLCPTRWTVRVDAIKNVVNQYECVLDALEAFVEPSNSIGASAESKTRANGLLHKFKMSSTLLALRIALVGFGILENLCKALQGKSQTVSGMLAAVDHTLRRLNEVRTDDEFHSIYSEVLVDQQNYGLDPFVMPRSRKGTRSNPDGPGTQAHIFPDALSLHRVCYFTMLDVAHSELQSRFDQDSFTVLRDLEQSLLSGVPHEDTIKLYPEIVFTSLAVQLPMFRSSYDYKSLGRPPS